jgi:hypothetical protein
VNVGGSASSALLVLSAPGQSDWYVVNLPYTPNFRNHSPTAVNIALSFNEGGVYRFEVHATCAAGAACGNALTNYSFGDNACTGTADCSTRGTTWPAQLYIRVFNAGGTTQCGRYQLQVFR